MWRPIPILLLISVVACGEVPPPETPGNLRPRARFSSPVWVQAGSEARFEATASYDPDGTIVAFRFLFGDGSAEITSATPVVMHTFKQAGIFTVWLTVVDAEGAEGGAAHRVGVSLDAPAACVESKDCGLDERCGEDGLCYRQGPGDACLSDEECAGLGLSCRAGVCAEAECLDDTVCAGGELCRGGLCLLSVDGGSGDGG